MAKKTKKEYLEQYAKYPRLSKAVLNKLRESGITWYDIVENPNDFRDASNGVPGFTYYKDTVPFGQLHGGIISKVIEDFEEETGTNIKPPEYASEERDYYNWLAWFALEYVVNEINDYLENDM